jgi:RND superfamily putative drug exporter
MLKIRKKIKKSINNKSLPPRCLRLIIPSVLIIIWFVVAGIGGPYFGKISEVAKTDLSTFLPKSAESTKANEQIKRFQSVDSIPAIIAFEKKSGKMTDDDIAFIEKTKKRIETIEGVIKTNTPPIVSSNKKAILIVIPISNTHEPKDILPEIRNKISKSDQHRIDVKITGPASFSADLTKAFGAIDGILLAVALSAVFIILLIVYRSPFLPIIVLLTSIFALTASILAAWHMAEAGIVTINGQVQGILFILVIGAATDYSLLYISRYREELYVNRHSWQATLKAIKGSVEPILASGGTVIAGLMCLLLSDLSSNKALGPVGAVGIAFAMVGSLTLLPSILSMSGRLFFWPRRPIYNPESHITNDKRHPAWAAVGRFVSKNPRPIWIIGSFMLLLASVGVWQLKAEGVSQSNLILGKSEARDGQNILNKHFAGGSGSPTYVVTPKSAVNKAVEVIDKNIGVDSISITTVERSPGQRPVGEAANKIKLEIRKNISTQLSNQKNQIRQGITVQMPYAPPETIEQVIADTENRLPSIDSLVDKADPFENTNVKEVDGNNLLNVTLKDSPDSNSAKQTIGQIRKSLHEIDDNILVGGATAAQADTNIAANHDIKVIIPAILASITLILMMLLRAIFAPILLLATTVLSFGATLGISALLFNHLWKFPGADPSVIIFGFVFLVALGIDYNIFLMTRVREESLKIGTRKGVIKALIVTGGVITSAGVVLATTFASLAVIPILFLAQLAFIVAFGVLLDTFIIRTLIAPAIVYDIGKKVWWPSSKHKD